MALMKLKQIYEGLQLRNSVAELLKIFKEPISEGIINQGYVDGASLIGTQINVIMSLYDYNQLSNADKEKCLDVKYYSVNNNVETLLENIPSEELTAEQAKTLYSVHYNLNYNVTEILTILRNDVAKLNNTTIPVETIDEFIITGNETTWITSALPNTTKVSLYINGILYSEAEEATDDNTKIDFWVERKLDNAIIHWQDKQLTSISSEITDKIVVRYFVDVAPQLANSVITFHDGTQFTTTTVDVNE